jgi:hypothetical protein
MTADAEKKVITINVKLLPKYHSDHAQLTRYQLGHRKDYVGKLTRVKCSPSDTIKELKAQIESARLLRGDPSRGGRGAARRDATRLATPSFLRVVFPRPLTRRPSRG